MLIQEKTATEIAYAYRDLKAAEELLAKVAEALSKREQPDIRDAFGRRQGGLQLGVPIHGGNGQTLYDVPWSLAKPVLEMYIANRRSIIRTLSLKAMEECEAIPTVALAHPPSPEEATRLKMKINAEGIIVP